MQDKEQIFNLHNLNNLTISITALCATKPHRQTAQPKLRKNTSEARNMVVKKQGDELAQAKDIMDKAEQAQIKAKRKAS